MMYDSFISMYQIDDVVIQENPSRKSRVQLIHEFIEFFNSVEDVVYDNWLLDFRKGNDVIRIYKVNDDASIYIEYHQDKFIIKFFSDESINKFMTDALGKKLPKITIPSN